MNTYNNGNDKRDNLFSFSVSPDQLSLDSLAFLGDAIYSLYFRLNTLPQARRRAGHQHNIVKDYVSASGQRKALEEVADLLDEEEKEIVRRGYNSRGSKKHGDDEDYKMATAFEALIGYLFLEGKTERIRELFERVI